jgi:hypothetical protein
MLIRPPTARSSLRGWLIWAAAVVTMLALNGIVWVLVITD